MFDANGNTLSDPSGKSYTWDFENRLTQAVNPGVGTTTFKYDPFGRRIQKSGPLGTTNYLYDGPNGVEEVDNNGNISAHYTDEPRWDGPMSMLRGGVISYYNQDGLNSVGSLTNSSGTVVQSYTYDSYGKVTASAGTLTNPFQYTGRELDPETGLLFYRARYYDPTAGRFISEDPIGFGGGENFYAYVHNNPLNLTDPLGLCDKKVPCYDQVRAFVSAHLADAKALASQLPGVTPHEVLAVSAAETTYGSGLAPHGNYFGIHGTGFAGQTGIYVTKPKTGKGVVTPEFAANGFSLSGQVFVNTEAPYLDGQDISNPRSFFEIIHEHGYGTDREGSYVDWMMRNDPGHHGPYALTGACLE